MKHNSNAVSVAQLAERLGAQQTTVTRHAAARNTAAGRTTAKIVAGAAIAGGAVLASGPIASAQSAEIPAAPSIEEIQAFANDLYAQYGGQLTPDMENQARQYADVAGIDLSFLQSLFPTGGAHVPAMGPVTSGFEERWGTFHNGTDFGAPLGSPIYAAKSGTVENAGPADGYGLWIRIRTDDGELLEYGHNNENYVSVGQRVTAGQQIGTVGNRGYSTGPHLHFGVQNAAGQWIDPVPWLAANGVMV
ncbi:M23 family metallopeptidase [Dietzia sp.]|uniref:M23 family metallopeptidase n=1 Tax=Dietzia sp. TaxID=1871616 RepID=UPI002FDB6DE5